MAAVRRGRETTRPRGPASGNRQERARIIVTIWSGTTCPRMRPPARRLPVERCLPDRPGGGPPPSARRAGRRLAAQRRCRTDPTGAMGPVDRRRPPPTSRAWHAGRDCSCRFAVRRARQRAPDPQVRSRFQAQEMTRTYVSCTGRTGGDPETPATVALPGDLKQSRRWRCQLAAGCLLSDRGFTQPGRRNFGWLPSAGLRRCSRSLSGRC
jgi:hypothetical protein